MGKGDYIGGGTVIGPQDKPWFGNGGVGGGLHPDANKIDRRKAHPLTPQAERHISNLRVDVAGLEQQLVRLETERKRLQQLLNDARADLNALLHHHGLPLERGTTCVSKHPEPGTTKTTRNQRKRRARENFINGQR